MAKAVIMAGGQGERFWPLTHKDFPKYRIRFGGKSSLLQETYRRLMKVYGRNNIYVVTTRPHAKIICRELPVLRRSHLMIEPVRHNTAAAIFLSSTMLERSFGPGEVVSFFPADHLIENGILFGKTMRGAIHLAKRKEMLVTIGIPPSFPATAYGYLQKGGAIPGMPDSYFVKRFVEKPDRVKAVRYLKSKDFFWNGGIFTWRLGIFMRTMRRFCPEFSKNFDTMRLGHHYKKLPNVSIDRALMEKADNVALYRTRMDWCDLGDWDMWYERSRRDENNNHADGLYYHRGSRDSLIVNETKKPVIVYGVSDLVIVQTGRGTLICPKGRAQEAALLSSVLCPPSSGFVS